LCICNQEETTTNNLEIGIEERVGEERREEKSEEEDRVNNTLQGRVPVPISPTPSSHLGGNSLRLRMVD
jgi:hypothetical protein